MLGLLLLLQTITPPEQATPYTQAWFDRLAQIERDAQNAPTVGDILDRGLKRLRGKPEKFAFNAIGYPDNKMTIGGAIVYSWVNNTSVGYGDTGIITCTVKVIVRRGLIVGTDFAGSNGACDRYARAVEPSFRGLH